MIELQNINKTYNKNRTNELHVLKDITLHFDTVGLVALYGKSGSGKTTLLNCIGGIENFDKGEYYIDGQLLSGKKIQPIAEYKRNHIGFVFQNYNLVEEDSVQDNLLLALDIAGEPSSIEKVNIALKAVNMAKYNKRKINTLSGGQKQRIAIARALIINPDVILADEPTGNLDRENSLQILGLLKSISKTTLVILVSHEYDLVNQFADRIITISDGEIINDENREAIQKNQTLSPEHKSKLPKITEKTLSTDNIAVTLYVDETCSKINRLRLFIQGNKIFLLDKEYEMGTASSDILAISKPAPAMSDNSYENVAFVQELSQAKADSKKTFTFNPIKGLLKGHLNKIVAIMLIFMALFFAVATSFIDGATKINVKKFQTATSDMVTLTTNGNVGIDNIYKIKNNALVTAVLPSEMPLNINFTQRSVLQANTESPQNFTFQIRPLPLTLLAKEKLIYGRMPTTPYEIVLDKFYIEKLFSQNAGSIGESAMFGITSVKEFLYGELLPFENMSLKIVGISDTNEPTFYVHNDVLNSISLPAVMPPIDNVLISAEAATFTDTKMLFGSNDDVYVSREYYEQFDVEHSENKTIEIYEKKYNIVGYYTNKEVSSNKIIVMTSDELERILFDILSKETNITVTVTDKPSSIEYFDRQEIYTTDTLEREIENYTRQQKNEMVLQLILSIAIAVTTTVLVYFSIQTTVMNNKSKYAIEIALGQPLKKVCGEFVARISLLTAIMAIPVYIIAQIIIATLSVKFAGLFTMLSFNPINCIIGLLLLILIPLLAAVIGSASFVKRKASDLLRNL